MLMGQRNNTVSHLNFFLLMNDKNIAILPVLEAQSRGQNCSAVIINKTLSCVSVDTNLTIRDILCWLFHIWKEEKTIKPSSSYLQFLMCHLLTHCSGHPVDKGCAIWRFLIVDDKNDLLLEKYRSIVLQQTFFQLRYSSCASVSINCKTQHTFTSVLTQW